MSACCFEPLSLRQLLGQSPEMDKMGSAWELEGLKA